MDQIPSRIDGSNDDARPARGVCQQEARAAATAVRGRGPRVGRHTHTASGKIHISRAARQATFPASFQFVAAMNPCTSIDAIDWNQNGNYCVFNQRSANYNCDSLSILAVKSPGASRRHHDLRPLAGRMWPFIEVVESRSGLELRTKLVDVSHVNARSTTPFAPGNSYRGREPSQRRTHPSVA
jgi:Magnesium chelatase, subunit ChlI